MPWLAAISAAILVFTGVWVESEEDGDLPPQLQYRHKVMEAVGAHMDGIVAIVREEVDHSDHLLSHAEAMHGLAKITPDIFPPGSEGGDARSEIWEDPEEFSEKLVEFREAASHFADTVRSADKADLPASLRRLGQSCRGCHRSYRKR